MSTIKKNSLEVPGASLYYEVRGSGPVLLMIHGGNGDADVFSGMVDRLSEWYTVVTYDRRGHSRSKQVNKEEKYRVETHGDDAHRLLAELTDEPAYVFSTSFGTVVGLDVATRHPEQVRALISHEPPLLQLLDGEEKGNARQIIGDSRMDFERKGLQSASETFTSSTVDSGSMFQQTNPEQLEQKAENMKFFIEHEAPAMRNYTLNIDSLKTGLINTLMRILPAAGHDSQGSYPYRCALGLAQQLELDLVELPGNHTGYMADPQSFAGTMKDILKS